ncbi:hypothetical protein OG289_42565 [Streptomyces sp. NBC_01235]|nr:hypothetical protein OG289_42565 [Streptomyces sp. NBC_01235]
MHKRVPVGFGGGVEAQGGVVGGLGEDLLAAVAEEVAVAGGGAADVGDDTGRVEHRRAGLGHRVPLLDAVEDEQF